MVSQRTCYCIRESNNFIVRSGEGMMGGRGGLEGWGLWIFCFPLQLKINKALHHLSVLFDFWYPWWESLLSLDTSAKVDCHSDRFQRLLRKRATFSFDTSLFCCPQLHTYTNTLMRAHTLVRKHPNIAYKHTDACTHTHCTPHVNALSLWFSHFTADINPSFTVDRPVLGRVCSLVSSTPRSFTVHTLTPTPRDLYSLCSW